MSTSFRFPKDSVLAANIFTVRFSSNASGWYHVRVGLWAWIQWSFAFWNILKTRVALKRISHNLQLHLADIWGLIKATSLLGNGCNLAVKKFWWRRRPKVWTTANSFYSKDSDATDIISTRMDRNPKGEGLIDALEMLRDSMTIVEAVKKYRNVSQR